MKRFSGFTPNSFCRTAPLGWRWQIEILTVANDKFLSALLSDNQRWEHHLSKGETGPLTLGIQLILPAFYQISLDFRCLSQSSPLNLKVIHNFPDPLLTVQGYITAFLHSPTVLRLIFGCIALVFSPTKKRSH